LDHAFASAGPIDRLVGDAVDRVSGQPELKATPVRATALPSTWHGRLARRCDATLPSGPYFWARVPLARGHAFELAGWEALPDGTMLETWAATLLDARRSDLVAYADPGRHTFRFAVVDGDRLDDALFLAAPGGALPSRAALARLFETTIPTDARVGLLAGAPPAGGDGDGASDRTVCACFAVGDGRLRRTLREHRLTTVVEIGAALGAGTNCGSCLPEIHAILPDLANPDEAWR
jgi:assimilatory nitrate reductase catalytic subunit